MMEQSPIFIPLSEIAQFPDPMETPDEAGGGYSHTNLNL